MKYFNPHIKFEKEKGKNNSRKEETSVTCVKCKKRFILPFRPRKPEILCDDCFKKKNLIKKPNVLKR
ncbi:MAG: hypothetical protein PHU51_01865 [Candidatus Nanoarchaeia archaeon]|jgi:CxxC-x17-CxxC domain-containing protein|nr:hypothetical protein [Candidatus Nanoarchaeia archaeon]